MEDLTKNKMSVALGLCELKGRTGNTRKSKRNQVAKEEFNGWILNKAVSFVRLKHN